MAKSRFLWVALAALLSAGCTADPEGDSVVDQTESAVARKLIHTSDHAVAGELFLYVSDDAVESLEMASASEQAMTRSGMSDIDEVLSGIGAVSIERVFAVDPRHEARLREAGMHRWYVVRFDEEQSLDQAALSLARLGDVEKVEFSIRLVKCDWGNPVVVDPDQMPAATRAVSYQFDDPMLSSQWHYINTGDPTISSRALAGADINAEAAWKIECGSSDIIVAVIDEGVDYTHPDLADNMWVNTLEKNGTSGKDDDGNGYTDDIYGYNFYANSGTLTWDAPKDSGHGTHVGGTVSAVNNNGIGVCGVAGGSGNNDGVKIMSCQIYSNEEGAGISGIAKAVQYAANNGACILQCSWGYDAGTLTSDESFEKSVSLEYQAFDYFMKSQNCDALVGGLVIFAAGNETTAMSAYPGAYNSYISVTALSADGLPTWYTNYGPGCNIAAPGGDSYEDVSTKGRCSVLSTLPGEKYGYMDGTSMACPHVSGVAALGLSYALKLGKQFTLEQYKALLLTSVNELNSRLTGVRNSYKTQLLNAYKDKMGTGSIDAFQVLMGVRGTRCVPVEIGDQQTISVQDYLGEGGLGLKLSSIEMSSEDMASLGMTSAPVLFGNSILLTCTKPGSGIIKIKLIAGGTAVGGGSSMGGMMITKELAVVARSSHASNGGWL